MKRRVAVATIVWLTLFFVLTLSPLAPSAGATPPTQKGWWKQTLTVGSIDLLSLLDPSTLDVPPDGLYIAGGTSVDKPRAFAAVTYDLANGEVAGPLRLTKHPLGVSVPGSGAMACPLDRPTFTPVQGGPIATAPAYDCLGGVTATIDADGSYLFDVRTLVRGGVVAVAILPTSQASRVVFASPPDGSLPVRAQTPPLPPATDQPTTSEPAIPVGDTTPFSLVAAPTTVEAPTVADNAPLAGGPPVDVARTATEGSGRPQGSLGRAYALLALAALAGGGWVYAGRGRDREAVATA